MAVADDLAIPDALEFFRRINPEVHLVPDENEDCLRLSSGAFKQRDLSVVWSDDLETSGRPPDQAVTATESHLVKLTAGDARALSLAAIRKPTEDEPAHGEIVGKKTKRIKNALVRASRWQEPPAKPDGTCDPPAGTRS